ncbi:PP2C family protein-serine/threonine phosphatase [Carbonactinospora thermoautotrophica]|uniref:PP2C family protein-serine/threonine phosphatase n=1 Tax=Carbonactinospora thermoautotrophica TaxID=1469144 RepID=UPI001E53BD31|nr:PP2C family protein-serine/threonine phosphatase [Carbonactinospora thermoautotrophica]
MSQILVLAQLAAAVLVIGWLGTRVPHWVSPGMLVLPVVVGGFRLRPRPLLALCAVVAAALVVLARSWDGPKVADVAVVTATALVVLGTAARRARAGWLGARGESMLFDLRDRLWTQGEMPRLPAEWQAEVVTRPARGEAFGGDFLVATRAGRTLEVVLVDVSGKGSDAGIRALQLSGAFGGLLGSLPPERFLPAANEYLLRQEWEEGFATAAHLSLDLHTGDYRVWTAGHPPCVQFVAGSGRWQVTAAEGPLLGVLGDAEYASATGRLARGDAILLYTDGLIEVPGRDLAWGIDRLLGEAERLVTRGFRHGARKLIDAVAHDVADDRALVLIWRT